MVIVMDPKSEELKKHAHSLYRELQCSPLFANDVILDDSTDSPGAKLHRAQLLGSFSPPQETWVQWY